MNNLFYDRKFSDLTNSLENSINNTINTYEESKFDENSMDELSEKLVGEFEIALPELKEKEIYQNKPSDTKISNSGRNHFQPNTVDGTKYTFIIPFSGDYSLFEIFPSSFTTKLPYGIVESNEIKVVYEVPVGQDASVIKTEFDNNLDTIKKYLGFLSKDIDDFNMKLEPKIKDSLKQRKEKLDKDDETANSFGFPIK